MHDWRHMLTYHLSLGKLSPHEVLELVRTEYDDFMLHERLEARSLAALDALDAEERAAMHAFGEFIRDHDMDTGQPVPRRQWTDPF